MKRTILIAAALLCAACSGKTKEDEAAAKARRDAVFDDLQKSDKENRDKKIHDVEYSGSGLGDLLAALQTVEPELYENTAARAETLWNQGEEVERALTVALSREAEAKLVEKWGPVASDEDLRDLLQVTLETNLQYVDVNPKLCNGDPNVDIPVAQEAIGVRDRLYHALAHILRSPPTNAAPATKMEQDAFSAKLQKGDRKVLDAFNALPPGAPMTPENARITCQFGLVTLKAILDTPGGIAVYRDGLKSQLQKN